MLEKIRLTEKELVIINHPWAREMQSTLHEIEYDRAIANTATDKAIKKMVEAIEDIIENIGYSARILKIEQYLEAHKGTGEK